MTSPHYFVNRLDDFFKEAKQFTIKAKQILGDRYGFDWEDRLEVLPIVIQKWFDVLLIIH